MHSYEQVVGEAIRVEYDEFSDRLCLVFEITNQQMKQQIKNNWTRDIEFRLSDNNLTIEEK